jgi:heterotetrameric sarcosine oxidase gamma subunit
MGSGYVADLTARGPVRPVEPTVVAGWEVTRTGAGAPAGTGLILTDLTPVAKVLVRARPDGATAAALGIPFGRAARDHSGALVTGSGPGEWLVLGPVGNGPALRRRLENMAAQADGEELVSVLDLTHGRALMRLTGHSAADALAKVCGIDLADKRTPDGTAFRSWVAKLVTDVVRDDQASASGQVPSYLLHCERSYGQYLFDAILDAGAEFGIDIGGFGAPGI